MKIASSLSDSRHAAAPHPRAFAKMVLVLLALNLTPASVAPAMAAECRLAILGDSLTAGYGVAGVDALPQKIAGGLQQAGIGCEVSDAGVSGDTSAGGLSRLDWVLSDKPTHLIVELGGNDGLRALPVAQLEHNLDQILSRAKDAGVKLFLAGIVAPPNLGRDYTDAFKAVYPRLAERYQVPLYPFLLDGVITDKALMQADGIHPNPAGVDEIVRRLLPPVILWLKSTGVLASSH